MPQPNTALIAKSMTLKRTSKERQISMKKYMSGLTSTPRRIISVEKQKTT